MNFSIIITTNNRKKSLYECLNSIVREKSNYKFEVIVILNGDCSYLEKYKKDFPEFNFYYIPQTTMSEAKNIALSKSQTEIFFFLDEDCTLSENYFSYVPFESNWNVLSGPELGLPLHNKFNSIAAALASPLCMGLSSFSHHPRSAYNKKASIDHTSFGNFWVKLHPSENKNQLFDRHIFKNETYYCLVKLKNNLKQFHFNPKLSVVYNEKHSDERLAKSLISANCCRILSFFESPKFESLIYFLPIIFFSMLLRMIFHFDLLSILFISSYSGAIVIWGAIKYLNFNLGYIYYHYYILICYALGAIRAIIQQFIFSYNKLRENNSLTRESNTK
jgi:glycosyltransferase involved in cell wall biosynthesis